VFQNSKCRFVEIVDERNGCVDVQQVVVRNFLALQLFEHFVEVTVEIPSLVRVFTVTQALGIVHGTAELRAFAAVEPIEYG